MSRPSLWRNEPTCLACPAERPADAWARGWRGPYCRACSERWTYHGRPDGGPPRACHAAPGSRAGRLEDYAELRSWGLPLEDAAERVGVRRGTAERYDADLRRTGRLAS
jgi:hypothetical protein